jgi:hypothetical protein
MIFSTGVAVEGGIKEEEVEGLTPFGIPGA